MNTQPSAALLLESLASGGKLDAATKYPIFDELGHHDAYHHGIYKLMGIVYDFRPFFKKYLVHWKYSGWCEQYAPNKTFIRKHAAFPSHVLEIVEKPQKMKH